MKVETKDRLAWLGEFPSEVFAEGKCKIIGSLGVSAVIDTDDGLVLFDIGINQQAKRIFEEVRKFSDKPVKYIIYSHGHFDHCFGYELFLKEIEEKGWENPQIIAHENVIPRFKKYAMLTEYHQWINSMQFSSVGKDAGVLNHETLDPTIIVKGNDSYSFKLGQYSFELYHNKGETDDSLWMYLPELKILFTGDLYLWCFPNVGNPYKVQRYPKDWAIAMEKMLEKDADYLVPGHGVLIKGKDNVKEALSITAEAMHFVHDEVVKRLNEGKWFEEIYHEMLKIYPEKFENSKYLKPIYGCYEFAIHATHRLYHGWYNSGNPTNLFPAKSKDIAHELLKINKPETYLEHGKKLFKDGKLQLALHIIDPIVLADKEDALTLETISLKSKILKKLSDENPSLIAGNILNNGATQLRPKIRFLRKKLN